ncbi:hypothetical protein BKA70DRAFT_1485408 [Coprinopsis sp. MPI-PUGE-AT-0042]|nr:hypothetical protein BKA70DRAFT_1485408 [Coprinopsis sp. MPI-PUGE-AT-0042]
MRTNNIRTLLTRANASKFTKRGLQSALPVSWLSATMALLYTMAVSQGMLSAGTYAASDMMLLGLTAFVSLLGGVWMKTTLFVQRHPSVDPTLDWMPEKRTLVYPSLTDIPHGNESGLIGGLERRDDNTPASSHVYGPYFLFGNLLTVIWSILTLYRHALTSQLVLVVHLVLQTYAIFATIHPRRRPELGAMQLDWYTHILSKGNAALVFLLLWNQSGLLERTTPPTGAEMINSGAVFVLMAVGAGPDPTLGVFLIYDLTCLIAGTVDGNPWRLALKCTTLFVTFVLAWDISGLLFCEGDSNGLDTRSAETGGRAVESSSMFV